MTKVRLIPDNKRKSGVPSRKEMYEILKKHSEKLKRKANESN